MADGSTHITAGTYLPNLAPYSIPSMARAAMVYYRAKYAQSAGSLRRSKAEHTILQARRAMTDAREQHRGWLRIYLKERKG